MISVGVEWSGFLQYCERAECNQRPGKTGQARVLALAPKEMSYKSVVMIVFLANLAGRERICCL